MDESIKFFVGLDVHKDTIAVAVAEAGRAPARLIGSIAHDVSKLRKLLARYGEPGAVQVVYEAGPTGYGLQRELARRGYCCQVIAPSLILWVVSTDHDPLFRFHRWLANLRVLEIDEIKSVPYASRIPS